MKNILIISTSLRNGNADTLKGAYEFGKGL